MPRPAALRFAQGRDPVDGEDELLGFLDGTFAYGGYRVRQLLVELVASPGFREFGEPTPIPSRDRPRHDPYGGPMTRRGPD